MGGAGGGRRAEGNSVAADDSHQRGRRLAERTRRWRDTRCCHSQPTAVGRGGGACTADKRRREIWAAATPHAQSSHRGRRRRRSRRPGGGWSPDSFPSERGQEAPLPASSWVVFSSRWRQTPKGGAWGGGWPPPPRGYTGGDRVRSRRWPPASTSPSVSAASRGTARYCHCFSGSPPRRIVGLLGRRGGVHGPRGTGAPDRLSSLKLSVGMAAARQPYWPRVRV